MSQLSILCVTQARSYALPFLRSMDGLATACSAELVLVADGPAARATLTDTLGIAGVPQVASRGYVESVLDEALTYCHGDFVLRLDDDERCSPAMLSWLQLAKFRAADHWRFPRVHFWGDRRSVIQTPALFPNYQTRLSIRAKSGGRASLYAESPFGPGTVAQVAIEHHKFLVRGIAERVALAASYDAIVADAGTGSYGRPLHLPERVGSDAMVVSYTDGRVPWTPDRERALHFSAQATS